MPGSVQHDISMADQVFIKYGQAMFRAQALEQDIENFVWAIQKKSGPASRSIRNQMEKESLGTLWKRVSNECREIDPVWSGNIQVFTRLRNYLTHRFFIAASGLMDDEYTARRAVSYLENFERCCAIANFHLFLLAQASDVTLAGRFSAKLEQDIARSRKIDESTAIGFEEFILDA